MANAIDEIAIHEAAHAIVAVSVGVAVLTMSLEPPITRFSEASAIRASRRANMAVSAAGQLAEERLGGRLTAETFEESLRWIFGELGDGPITHNAVDTLAAYTKEDDIARLVYGIASYSDRRRGWTEFRKARTWADRILVDHWGEVEALARLGRSIADPQTHCVVPDGAGGWTVARFP